jgi:hypothetical protein
VERLLFIDVHHVKRFSDAGKLINIIHFIYVAVCNFQPLKWMIFILNSPLVIYIRASRMFFLARVCCIILLLVRLIALFVFFRND